MPKRGTRVGGVQRWTYSRGRWSEYKYKPRNWRFVYQANKHQDRKGHFPVGGRIKWKIDGYQYVYKDKDNHYRTTMVGHKRLVSKNISRRRR